MNPEQKAAVLDEPTQLEAEDLRHAVGGAWEVGGAGTDAWEVGGGPDGVIW